jgi:serine-type D-Ala-D-Ala carboxypeptidase/endopeptidase (penicillin-binding protein 4)
MPMLLLALIGLHAELDAILDQPALSGAVVAAQLTRMDGSVLYERNPALRVVPASNQKVFTAVYALERLGPEHRPVTRIWREKDRLVVDAPGDPSLTYSQLLEARRKLGIKAATPVHVRQGYRPLIPPSWEHDDLPHRYAAPITAFSVDRGSFELWAEKGQASFSPTSYGVRIQRIPEGARRVEYDPFDNVARVYGSLPAARTRLDTLALRFPDRAAASVLGAGGALSVTSRIPAGAPTLTLQGSTVREMVAECLTRSDNNLAEHLLLMSAATEGPLGEKPYEEAAKRMRAFFASTVGVNEAHFRPVDGSGMSRHNLVTASALNATWRWALGRPYGELWQRSLAAPGRGTLASRLSQSSFRGKTGTLNSTASLSGYVDSGRQTLVVSLVFNNAIRPSADLRGVADAFVRKIEQLDWSDGTIFEAEQTHEGRTSHSNHRAIHGDRVSRSDRYRGFAR